MKERVPPVLRPQVGWAVALDTLALASARGSLWAVDRPTSLAWEQWQPQVDRCDPRVGCLVPVWALGIMVVALPGQLSD
jgi:hypothetical protein